MIKIDSIQAGINEWAKQIVTKIKVTPLLKKVADRNFESCRPFSWWLALVDTYAVVVT